MGALAESVVLNWDRRSQARSGRVAMVILSKSLQLAPTLSKQKSIASLGMPGELERETLSFSIAARITPSCTSAADGWCRNGDNPRINISYPLAAQSLLPVFKPIGRKSRLFASRLRFRALLLKRHLRLKVVLEGNCC